MRSKYKFTIEMYRTTIHYYPTKEEFEKVIGHELNSHIGGSVYNNEDGGLDVFVPLDLDGSLSVVDLAHEAFHAADFIADNVGLVYSPGSANEHMAYLVGSIVGGLWDQIAKARKRMEYVRNNQTQNS